MSYFLPDSLISQLNSKYASTTVRNIDSSLKRLHVELFQRTYFDSSLVLDSQNSITEWLKSFTNSSVRKKLTSHILIVIRLIDSSQIEHYVEQFDQVAKLHNYEYHARIFDDDKFIPLEQLYSIFTNMSDDHMLNCRDKIIAGLYSGLMPALRGQDFFSLKWADLPENTDYDKYFKQNNYNFIDTNTMSIVLGDYKTCKAYKIRKIVIPSELHPLISRWRQFNNSDTFLFNNAFKPYQSAEFSQTVKRIFRHGITVDTLRHIYTTEMTKYIDTLPNYNRQDKIRLLEKIATFMAHSINTQTVIYSGYKGNLDIPTSSLGFMERIFNEFMLVSRLI
mgnify:CR=1 FL=1